MAKVKTELNLALLVARRGEAPFDLRVADLVAFTSSAGGRQPSEGRYAIALRSQFIACPSASTDSHTLMLRRDLEEACVVGDQRSPVDSSSSGKTGSTAGNGRFPASQS